jgi:AraC family transcriptional regulator
MEPRIVLLSEKKLIGKSLKMTLANDRTVKLWKSFMPHRKEIKNNLSSDLFDLQIYKESLDFKDFNEYTEFEKWAAIEVSDFSMIPEDMKAHILKAGLYAVFMHKGPASTVHATFQYIFLSWLPNSEYDLDKRDHFELLGKKYKNNEADSEEEVWIPIRRKE